MQQFELTKEFITSFIQQIDNREDSELVPVLNRLFAADIAEIFDSLDLNQAVYITNLIETHKKVDVLVELEEDVRRRFFEGYTSKDIALQFIDHMDSDDAVDILSVLPTKESEEIISYIPDKKESLQLTMLLRYPDDSAGGLMAKELIKVNIDWTVSQCTEEIRKQAEEVSQVYTVYVVDQNDTLLGLVSLKKIILSQEDTRISTIYDNNIIYGHATDSGESIAQTIKKYDLVALPIVDSLSRLVGRITVDDVLEFVTEEADKDYQMLSGISENVEARDKVWVLSRSRLPWLLIGMAGGLASSVVIGGFENDIMRNVNLAFFMPLVMAMGGNAGVQSSSIIVQGLANNTINSAGVVQKLGKEFLVALVNGLICSMLVLLYGLIFNIEQDITLVVSISLLSVIILASIMGTLVPLVLEKFEIDPALATGPFITTTNDLVGLFLYFLIGNSLLL
jgi:magnesium transporter